jgi:signal peptidase II
MTKPEVRKNLDSVPQHSSSVLRTSLVIRHSSFVIFLYALDQISKWLVVKNIELGSGHPVIPGFFDLVYLTNTGAAFSALSDNNTFFTILSAAALVVLVVLYVRGAFGGALLGTAFSLLTAGVLGNLTDRLIHKHVIDFLLFDLHVKFANPWPAFNVADSCICVAATLFIVSSFCEERKSGKKNTAEPGG